MHRAETILATIETLLTGLGTTGANVRRGRLYELHTLPALTIEKGDDSALGEMGSINMTNVDRVLAVNITATVETSTGQETALNNILEEVYAAIMADHTLGLPCVLLTWLEGDTAPEINTEGQTPVAESTAQFSIRYRHSFTQAGA